MKAHAGLFREPKPEEVPQFVEWADDIFAACPDELVIQAIWHPLVRKRLGELLIERADQELLTLVKEEA